MKKCTCACHENVLGRPYDHDDKCCEQMNGHVVVSTTQLLARLKEQVEKMKPKDTKIKFHPCNPSCHESGKEQAVADLLSLIEEVGKEGV